MTEESVQQNEQHDHLRDMLIAREMLIAAIISMTDANKRLEEWVKRNAKRNDDPRPMDAD